MCHDPPLTKLANHMLPHNHHLQPSSLPSETLSSHGNHHYNVDSRSTANLQLHHHSDVNHEQSLHVASTRTASLHAWDEPRIAAYNNNAIIDLHHSPSWTSVAINAYLLVFHSTYNLHLRQNALHLHIEVDSETPAEKNHW